MKVKTSSLRETLKAYYNLTKPGIIYGNLLSGVAGFLLAAKDHIRPGLLVATMIGMSLVIGSACVFNNYIDRGIDKKMARTKKRALVSGSIPGSNALVYACTLGIIGFTTLIIFVNWIVVAIGIVAMVNYVILYGYTKRYSVHGTLVGTVAGAAPIVAGYSAVTGHLDTTAVMLFLILAIWQMPHFYAIATYRLKDYKEAGLPVLPVKYGIKITKIHIILYVLAFIIVTLLMTILGFSGLPYFVVMAIVGIYWLWQGIGGLTKGTNDTKWAKKMFLTSLLVLTVFCVMLSLNTLW